MSFRWGQQKCHQPLPHLQCHRDELLLNWAHRRYTHMGLLVYFYNGIKKNIIFCWLKKIHLRKNPWTLACQINVWLSTLSYFWLKCCSQLLMQNNDLVELLTCRCKHMFCLSGKWFEVSPHEAGFTELGLFIETSLLGSKFQRGELLEQKPEMDMVKLQG